MVMGGFWAWLSGHFRMAMLHGLGVFLAFGVWAVWQRFITAGCGDDGEALTRAERRLIRRMAQWHVDHYDHGYAHNHYDHGD